MIQLYDLKSASMEELAVYVSALGEKPFRARQIYEWMHVKHVTSVDAMTNLPKGLREQLKERCSFTVLTQLEVQVSKQDGTRKYLFGLDRKSVV